MTFLKRPAAPRGRIGLRLVAVAAAILAAGVWWFRAERGDRESSVPARSPAPSAAGAGDFAEYSRSAESCRGCHAKEFESWAKSNHGMAERALKPELDYAAFDPPKEISHGTQKSTARLRDGKPEMLTASLANKPEPFAVDRVIGHDPLRQFLVAGEGGRFQTLELAWDPGKQEWFDVYGNEDRKPGEWGHWTGRGMTWNAMCAACHNTALKKNYDAQSDTFQTTMAERTVSCEACHGPMKAHNEWQTAHRGQKNDPAIRKLSREQMFDTCAQCHARRAELTGDFRPGDSFFDHHSLTIVDESDLFYPDGQVRDENYEFSAFLGSKMHAAGVRCIDCHDPHAAKPALTGDAVCMKCHTAPLPQFPKAPVIVPVAHTFHKPESTGSRCVNCHMPVTTYMQRHPRHDHGFTTPDPLLTKESGIPNACNRCHADKDAAWAVDFTTQWFGDKMNRPSRQRAQLLAKARRGDAGAREGLIEWLRRPDETPSWKASACLLLERWISDGAALSAVQAQLAHDSPLVRAAAVRALTPLTDGGPSPVRDTLRPLMKDTSRSVRLAAAWALRDDVLPDSPPGKELAQMLSHNADQPSGRMQLGQYEFARGHPDSAIAQMRRAIEWDPNSPPFHHDLAIMLSSAGRTKEAIAALEAASKLDPRQAVYHYEMGLAWNELRDIDKTVSSLEQAVKLDAGMHRAWYNLALARNSKGDANGAIEALGRGEAANPADPALPYARATILMKLGKKEEALAAAQKALVAQPQNPEFQQLVRVLMK
jgi:tetratricopeptide (TPR) repeat protein